MTFVDGVVYISTIHTSFKVITKKLFFLQSHFFLHEHELQNILIIWIIIYSLPINTYMHTMLEVLYQVWEFFEEEQKYVAKCEWKS